MTIVYIMLLVPLIVAAQLVIPPLILLNSCLKAREWTLADAFFTGVVLNVFLAIGLLPLVQSTQALAVAVRIALVLCVGAFVLLGIKRKGAQEYIAGIWASCRRSVVRSHVLIAAITTLLLILFVGTHNLGYDDVAHLHYLAGVFDGNVFPVYRDLVDKWEAARYPAFGILIGVLGCGVQGSGFWLYYIMGGLIHICFFVKVYEFCYSRTRNVWQGMAGTALTALVLSVFSLGNYFNYGIYPLGLSKLLFMTGVCYLLISWRLTKQRTWFFLGAGLLTAGVLYHLNLVLLFFVVVPFLLLFIYSQQKGFKKWLLYCCFFFSFSVLTAPALLAPQNGILHYIEPVRVEKSGDSKAPVEKPSILDKIIYKVERLVNWVQDGRYKSKYIKRAFSVELFVVPVIVVLLGAFSLHQLFSIFLVSLFLLIISIELARTVPRQMIISSFRSGTSWMLADLIRSGVDFRSQDTIHTDPYTGLYLKILGRTQVEVMDMFEQVLLFYPFFSLQSAQKQLGESVAKDYLINGRMVGIPGVTRLAEKKKDVLSRQQTFVQEASHNFNLLNFSTMIGNTGKIIQRQLLLPVFVKSIPPVSEKSAVQSLMQEIPGNKPLLWKDKAIIPLTKLRAGTKIEIDTPGAGYETDEVAVISAQGDKVLRLIKRDIEDKMFYVVEEDVERVLLVVINEEGHFHGLGRVDSISVNFLQKTEKFSFE